MQKLKGELTNKGINVENQEVKKDLARARGIISKSLKDAGEQALGEQILNNFIESFVDDYAGTEATPDTKDAEPKSVTQKTNSSSSKDIGKPINSGKPQASSLKNVGQTEPESKSIGTITLRTIEDLANLHRMVNETGQTVIIKGITREFLEKLCVEEDCIEKIFSNTNEEPVLICSPDKGEEVLGPCIPIFSKNGKFDGVYDIWENEVLSESEFYSPFDEEAEDELGSNYFNKVSMQEGFANAEQLVVGNDGTIAKSDTTDVPSGLKKWLTSGINKKEIENKIKTLKNEIETLEGQVDDDGHVKLNRGTYFKKKELEKLKSVLEPDSSLSKEDIGEEITNKFESRAKDYKLASAAEKIELNTTQNTIINGRKLPQYFHMRPWQAGNITEDDIKNYGTGNENDLSANNYQKAYGIVPETLQLLDAMKAQNLMGPRALDLDLKALQDLAKSKSEIMLKSLQIAGADLQNLLFSLSKFYSSLPKKIQNILQSIQKHDTIILSPNELIKDLVMSPNFENKDEVLPQLLQDLLENLVKEESKYKEPLLEALQKLAKPEIIKAETILNVVHYLQVSYSEQIHRSMDNFERACAQVSIESNAQKDALLAIVANAKNPEEAYNTVIEKSGFKEINDLSPDSLKNAVNAAFGLVRKFTNASALSDMDMSIIANTLGKNTVLVSKDKNGKDIPYERNINLFIKGNNGEHIPVIQNENNELLTKDETGKYTELPEGTQLFMPTYMIRRPNYEDEEEVPVTVDIDKNEVYSMDGARLPISDRRDPISSPCLFPVSNDLGKVKDGKRGKQFSFNLKAYEDKNIDIMRDERDPIHCYHNESGKLVYRQENEEITVDPSICLQFTEDYRPYIPS